MQYSQINNVSNSDLTSFKSIANILANESDFDNDDKKICLCTRNYTNILFSPCNHSICSECYEFILKKHINLNAKVSKFNGVFQCEQCDIKTTNMTILDAPKTILQKNRIDDKYDEECNNIDSDNSDPDLDTVGKSKKKAKKIKTKIEKSSLMSKSKRKK